MRKAIIALAVANLVMLPLTIATCEPDATAGPGVPVAPEEVQVSPLAVGLGAALDYVAGLPESRDPVHYGSRTFEVNGKVLVKVDAEVADAATVIEERGWTLVARSPRTCGDTWEFADGHGFPFCWLHDDPDALYLRVSSARSLNGGDYEVVVHPYRNIQLPRDHTLDMGLIQTGEFDSPTGNFEENDFDGHEAELARLISGLSDHPGVLSDGGHLSVRVGSDGVVSHEGEFSGWYYSNPNGGDSHPRGNIRMPMAHLGPLRPPVTEDDRRHDAAMAACKQFEWGSDDHKRCRREAYDLWREIYAKERERNLAAVAAARAIVEEVVR